MLKKLRGEFVLFSMSIVIILLAMIFSLLYFFTARTLEQESLRMIERIAHDPALPSLADRPHEELQLPYFCILRSPDGETVISGGGFFDLSDEELCNSILSITDGIEEKIGIIKQYSLRFARFDTPNGECVVYADMTNEKVILNNMLKTFSFIGTGIILVFLGISILLARWTVKPVERTWLQQKQFVADASHELKTPLTVIITNAELLKAKTSADDERRRFTDDILCVAEQMRGLVESLLELARLDNEHRKSAHSVLSLSDAVAASSMLFEPVFFEKGMPFSCEIEPDIMMVGCEAELKQLTEILLDNAVKYAAPQGETVLSLKRSSARHCLLEVADQGDPIPEEEMKNLFRRFYRADRVRTMNHSYGLGLAIAKRICEQHRGHITVQSADGWNSFTVELLTK